MRIKSNMKIILLLIQTIFLLILISCDKQYSLYEEYQFSNPYPADGAKNVQLKQLKLGFSITAQKPEMIKKVFVDTINPPINQNPSLTRVPVLQPNTKYYWYLEIGNSNEVSASSIQSFKTVGFDGEWELSSKYLSDSEIIPELDSLFSSNYDLISFNISMDNALIKSVGQNADSSIMSKFIYDTTLDSIHFIEIDSKQLHSFKFSNLTCTGDECNLTIKNSKNHYINYTRKQ